MLLRAELLQLSFPAVPVTLESPVDRVELKQGFLHRTSVQKAVVIEQQVKRSLPAVQTKNRFDFLVRSTLKFSFLFLMVASIQFWTSLSTRERTRRGMMTRWKALGYFYLAAKLAAAWGNGHSWVSYITPQVADTYCGLATILPGDGLKIPLQSYHSLGMHRRILLWEEPAFSGNPIFTMSSEAL